MVCSLRGSPSPWRRSYSSAKSNGLCVNNEDQVPKRGKSKLGDPRPPQHPSSSSSIMEGLCLSAESAISQLLSHVVWPPGRLPRAMWIKILINIPRLRPGNTNLSAVCSHGNNTWRTGSDTSSRNLSHFTFILQVAQKELQSCATNFFFKLVKINSILKRTFQK